MTMWPPYLENQTIEWKIHREEFCNWLTAYKTDPAIKYMYSQHKYFQVESDTQNIPDKFP